jgi:F420H(2)-dependent quinone reductase
MAGRLARGGYRIIGWVLTQSWFHPIHRRLYRRAGGRGILGRALGVDMVLLTTNGRRTGRPRTVPLVAIRAGEGWLVVGSNGGRASSPAWTHNLEAHGRTTVDHHGRQQPHTARRVEGAEYDRRWRQAVAAYPGYAVYRDLTERDIPLFVLEPVPDPPIDAKPNEPVQPAGVA